MDMSEVIKAAREVDQSFRNTQRREHVGVIVDRIEARIEDDILLFIHNSKPLNILYDVPATPFSLCQTTIAHEIEESLKAILNIDVTIRYVDPTLLRVYVNV